MTTILEAEIHSQPETVGTFLRLELPRITDIAAQLPSFDYVLVAARGSSDHAALYAKYVWGKLAGYPVALAAPSLYTLYDAPPRLANALVVGISQSGQSPDIAAVLEAAREQGRPTIAITNDVASPLGRVAEHVVDLHAGAERSVAATKTYTAQLAAIAAFAATWSEQADRLTELRAVPDAMRATLGAAHDISRSAERYRYVETLVVVGRGYNYATAYELALKLKELTYVMAEPYSSADFRHGPIATVHAGSPILLVAPSGRASTDLLDLATELRRRDAELLVISDDVETLALARTPLPLPAHALVPEWLTPLTAVLPGQQLALALALAKDLNPDEPRGLAKVTRTR